MPKKKEREEIEQVKNCPECGSTHISRDYVRAELVCDDCGLVIDDDLIDQGPEWRAFDSEQKRKRARTGPPMKYTLHDKGLSTSISWMNRDAYGRSIPTKNRAQIYRLRKWQQRTQISSTIERSLASGFADLNRMSSSMGLPRDVRERAGMLFKQVAENKLIRGRSRKVLVAATIYVACRLNNMPRTLEEVSNVSQSPKKEIGRSYRFLARKLKLKMRPTSPIDYVSRFCSELRLSHDVKTKTIEILKVAIENELTSGRGPVGLTAAAIYMASVLCGERKTQIEIANISGVTEVTIRNRYKELAEKLDIEITL